MQTGSEKKHTEKTTGTPTTTRGQGNEMRRSGNPTHEEIAKRAYEIFMARGGQHGRHEEDWYQAMRELTTTTRKS